MCVDLTVPVRERAVRHPSPSPSGVDGARRLPYFLRGLWLWRVPDDSRRFPVVVPGPLWKESTEDGPREWV